MFSMFEKFRVQDEYAQKIGRLRDDLRPARDTGSTECLRCGHCCWTRPGRLSEEEFGRAAEFMGLTPKEFFAAHCIVDDFGDGLVVALRREHQTPAKMIDWRQTFSTESPCTFFTGNECKIYPVRPEECIGGGCFSDDEEFKTEAWPEEKLRGLGWDGIIEE